ncbi:MAG: NAD-glutamate dehydrogenase domain-containing protein, partial [Pseudomonadota bacterium]
VNFPYSVSAIAKTLVENAEITKILLELFDARFNPAASKANDKIIAKIETKFSDVTNINDDKILRRLLNVIMASLRSNYYQLDKEGKLKSYISIKFDSAKVPELPLPRPFAEIFVYSARVEGIHLRGGKVARGGLRWSDRRDDFRTEVLGLMKAQMVKNSVIVPVGSKGGFVLKQAPTARDALMEEGIACYKTFLSGLLDLTDNIVNGKIVAPANIVRHDADDPYLVVAADKGTATFSDYANSVSEQYGFWLGDAFASGGSVGYDHKKMAITARGAFVSVARHFREMNIDIYSQDFTVVGIGDMAGDVFGNGMLLSKHIRLIAAFNHQHIFLDPNPDAKTSYIERERLFNLPRSSWRDYNTSLISQGGGIYDRSSKSISLSPEIRQVFGITAASLSPDELIKSLLTASVDLLWNGGIGTYVKAEDETHEQVGDRANNALRINGKQLKCKVVGEGGNLGFTQKGRIEYATIGGRINTDAIDNSAGVDCSDHEVNIKIGLGGLLASGKLAKEQRDILLASMTNEVANLVLSDNILQSQAITIEEMNAAKILEEHIRLINNFERINVLDRSVEFLPNDRQLLERKNAGKGLARPEIAVLLAYSKMILYPELLKSSLPDEPYFNKYLEDYFPTALKHDFKTEIAQHQLKREIIATVVTNDIVNHTGVTLIHALAEDTGQNIADVARAYIVASQSFNLSALWNKIEAQDGKISVAIQIELFQEIIEFARHITLWFLRNQQNNTDITKIIAEFSNGVKTYSDCYKSIISEEISASLKERSEYLLANNVPAEITDGILALSVLFSTPDLVRVANDSGRSIAEVGEFYFSVGSLLSLDWLRSHATKINTTSHWDAIALASIISNIYEEQRRLTSAVLNAGSINNWQSANNIEIERFGAFIRDLKMSDNFSLTKLVIAEKKIKELGGI